MHQLVGDDELVWPASLREWSGEGASMQACKPGVQAREAQQMHASRKRQVESMDSEV